MNIEHLKYLHLFTLITEEMPPVGWWIVLNHSGRIYQDLRNRNGSFRTTALTHWLDLSKLTRKDDIACKCTPDETTGNTTVRCCNICGKPTEEFWTKKLTL